MRLIIQGIRGIPAQHGGFETFAESLALFLVDQGWHVTVYCQEQGDQPMRVSQWHGVQLIHIYTRSLSPLQTISFDFQCILHSLKLDGLVLTLGYNTAIFNTVYRFFSKSNVINMDGFEWKRDKWGLLAKIWFLLNERIAGLVATRLVADHPVIADYFYRTWITKHKTVMIPYGAIEPTGVDSSLLHALGVSRQRYALIVSRIEPENSILEIVQAFVSSKTSLKLVVLGAIDRQNEYHKAVVDAADSRVVFKGAIYDKAVVQSLRVYCAWYFHGHQVGGTNPSLVEALAAGNAIVAHDNDFNRWVAGEAAVYFRDSASCSALLDGIDAAGSDMETMRRNAIVNFNERFRESAINEQYLELLSSVYE